MKKKVGILAGELKEVLHSYNGTDERYKTIRLEHLHSTSVLSMASLCRLFFFNSS